MKGPKNVDDLVRYVYKVYKEPSPWWTKAHFTKRCIQIHAAETVLQRCLDSPLYADPIDIIDGYLMEVHSMQRMNDNKQAASILIVIEETLENLIRYLS